LLVWTTNFIPRVADKTTPPDPSTKATPSFPPMIINTYTTVFDLLHQTLRPTIHSTLNFAYTAITHILTSLCNPNIPFLSNLCPLGCNSYNPSSKRSKSTTDI